MILAALLQICAACAAAPIDIRCPDATKACHLLVDLSDKAHIWPQPFPLKAVRIMGNRVWWLDGITFATASQAPRNDLNQARNIPLNIALGNIRAVAASGKNLLVLSPEGLHSIEPDASIQLLSDVQSAWTLAADNSRIAWTTLTKESDFGSVMDRERGVLAKKELKPGALAVDESGVYWVSFAQQGAIRALPLGQKIPVTLAKHQPEPRAIALDKDQVYWLCDTKDGHSVRSISKSGGEVSELAHWPSSQGTTDEERLVVWEGAVYWIAGGQLMYAKNNEVIALTQGIGRVVSFDVSDQGIVMAVNVPATQ